MVQEWKTLKQEIYELPSGFNITIKLAEGTDLDKNNVVQVMQSMSMSSGRFFFPMRVEDVPKIVELLKEWCDYQE